MPVTEPTIKALTVWSALQCLLSQVVVAAAAAHGPRATVLNGTYEGLYLAPFQQDLFLGMPYAQDTSGPNRFRIPQALNETWNGTRSATVYGPACPDEDLAADGIYGMGEDCLSINVVRPTTTGTNNGNNNTKASTTALPVMFWIHGGSYQVGTSSLENYNLSYIVQRSVDIGQPVIGVSINYRKGGWGLMYSREIQVSQNPDRDQEEIERECVFFS